MPYLRQKLVGKEGQTADILVEANQTNILVYHAGQAIGVVTLEEGEVVVAPILQVETKVEPKKAEKARPEQPGPARPPAGE